MTENPELTPQGKQYHFLLADDDLDDRHFFQKVLKVLSPPMALTSVDDGEKLMNYLNQVDNLLPDVLFLDLNMPRKNGSECLVEIKSNKRLNQIPVIIYSTSHHDEVADVLYSNGAHYFIKKTNIDELKKLFQHVIELLGEAKITRPTREKFKYNPKHQR